MRYYIILITLLLSPSFAVAEIRPTDFAYGRPLHFQENGAVFRFEVPLEIYRTVSESDLSDIRIFNSEEVAVPHVLRLPKIRNGITETTVALPFFPLYRKENTPGGSALSIRVNKGEDGTIIDIESGDGDAGGARKLFGYLIDITKHGAPIYALDLNWPADAEDFATDVSLEYSLDLTKWEPLAPRSTIVRKRFNGREIVRKRIEIPHYVIVSRVPAGVGSPSGDYALKGIPKVNLMAGYLRLSWLPVSDGVELKEVLAVQQTGEPPRERTWTAVERKPAEANDSNDKILAYEYDSSARLPVDRIRIGFPEKNTLAKISVFSRPGPESKWRYRQSGILYNLESDKGSLIEDTIHTGLASDRYWRLEIDRGGAGGFRESPAIRLGWLPHELLFVAHGKGPFMMAYGSARLGGIERDTNSPELISRVIGKNEDALVKKARLSEKIELGGPELLIPLPPPLPWMKWLLWCVLILGVGIIAKMAVSLLKGMDNNQ